MNRFLDLADYERDQVKDMLGLAARLQRHPQPQALAGKVLGLLFLNPSLRTLASFQSAIMRLGGTAVVITPGQGTSSVTVLCEPDAGAWVDLFAVDEGSNYENAEAIKDQVF